MPVTTITYDNATPRAVPRHRVYLRTDWAGDWEEEEHLHCNWMVFTANPDTARAQFTWKYGRILRPGETTWQEVARLDNLRHFIKVEFTVEGTTVAWHGVLEEDNGEQKGVLANGPEAGQGSGVQLLTAYGLDVMLQRQLVRTSQAYVVGNLVDTLDRAIEFNAKAQVTSDEKLETGNRSPEPGPGGQVYVFAGDLQTAKYWTSLNICEYLLKYHPPTDAFASIVIPWRLEVNAFFGVIPDWDKPRKMAHGRTLKQLLDELLDRRRLLGYTVQVDESVSPAVVKVFPFTFAPADVTYEGNTIGANDQQKRVMFDSDPGVQMAFIRRSSLEAVDQVVCTGARAVVCMTLTPPYPGVSSGTRLSFAAQWTAAEESEYAVGASLSPGYGALEIWEQEARNKTARNREHLKRVYSYFGLAPNWDGSVAAPAGPQNYFPYDKNPGLALPAWLPGLRFDSHLPLKTDHNYAFDVLTPTTPVDSTPPGQKWEYRPMLVAIKRPATSGDQADPESLTGYFQVLSQISSNTEHYQEPLGLEDGHKWSASVRPQEDAPGIVISVQGQPQHVLAKSDFLQLAVDEALDIYEWKSILATVAMKVDLHALGVWPELPGASQAVRRQMIDMGDDFRQHYVAPGTVVGVTDTIPVGEVNNLQSTAEGGYIRDDRDKLTALARLAYEWYRTERQSLELRFAFATSKLSVGDLITAIGQDDTEQTINSVVTSVKYEFSLDDHAGGPGWCATTVTTQFAELNLQSFLGEG